MGVSPNDFCYRYCSIKLREGKGGTPSQALPRQIPPFVTCGDIFPRSGGSLSSKGEPLAWRYSFRLNCKVCGFARASPFGRGGTAQAVTERARLLTERARTLAERASSVKCASNVSGHDPTGESSVWSGPQAATNAN